ncbi:MAG: hypothetical protein WA210_14235 [Burkholderiaceae bacterium]
MADVGDSGKPLPKKLGIAAGMRIAALKAPGDCRQGAQRLRKVLEPNAVLWVSWPKKAAKVATGHHARRDPRSRVANGLGRRGGVRGERRLLRFEALCARGVARMGRIKWGSVMHNSCAYLMENVDGPS